MFTVPRQPKIDASNLKDICVVKGENIELEVPFDGNYDSFNKNIHL